MSVSGSREATTPDEPTLVQALLQSGLSVMRAYRLGDGPADASEAETGLRRSFDALWARVQQVDLQLEPEAARVGGQVVLRADEDSEALLAVLSEAGIGRLVIRAGAEMEEARLFLAAVVAATRNGIDGSGLLTALFRADLEHIDYEQAAGAEPPASTPKIAGPQQQPTQEPEAVRQAVRRDASTPDAGVVRLEKFDSTLYFLDQREIEYLKSAIDREYSQDRALNALDLLLDILESRSEASVRAEVLAILRDFLPALLVEGRFEAVARLVAGTREATREAVGLEADHKEALDRLRSSVSGRAALTQLFHAMEAGAVAPTTQSMDVLLRELRPTAVREVLTWGERLSDPETRAAVVEALDAFFKQWPHGLSRILNAEQRDVVRAGLVLAGRLKLTEFVDIVSEIADHRDAGIRRQVAKTFAAISTAPALRGLLRMAADPDAEVRTIVYRTFTARPSRGAFGTFERALTQSDLEARGQKEKRTLFEAFGSVAGPEGIAVLEPLMRGRNPSGRRPSAHTRACAATALGIIGTPAARSLLQTFAQDRDPLVRSAVGAALRGER